jgi:hypothetical protein
MYKKTKKNKSDCMTAADENREQNFSRISRRRSRAKFQPLWLKTSNLMLLPNRVAKVSSTTLQTPPLVV